MSLRGITRAGTLLAILCMLPAIAHATAQQPDVLIYKGKTYDLFANPLEGLYPNERKRPQFFVEPRVLTTGNWRGYVATWTIENNFLYLVKIKAWTCNRNLTGCRKVEIRNVFGGRYRNGKVRADWFSGDLLMPDGKMLQYVHMGYGSIYEREITLRVKSGKVVEESTVDNTTRTLPSPLELQRQELEKMRPKPL